MSRVKKGDWILIGASIAGLILIAIIVLNIDRFFPTPSVDVPEQALQKQTVKSVGVNDTRCEAVYGVGDENMMFIYSSTCPVCHAMMPRVDNLMDEGYSVYYADMNTPEGQGLVRSCFSDIYTGYVPLFVCRSTGESHLGGMTDEDLRSFAERCV